MAASSALSSAIRSRICGDRARASSRRRPCPDAAAQALAAAGLAQPGREVGQPRDLDLQPGLAARRVAVEDLEDHGGSIEDVGRGRALEVALLGRRQLVVDEDDGGARRPGGRGGASRSSDRPRPPRPDRFPRSPFLPGGPLTTMPVPPVQAASSFSLPSPSSVAAPTPCRFCVTSPTTSKPSVSHRRLSSFSDDRCSASVTPASCTATSTALGRGAPAGADMRVLSEEDSMMCALASCVPAGNG